MWINSFGFVACLSMTAFGLDPMVQPTFPADGMSGSEITEEVQGGVYTDINDSSLSYRNESLFITNKYTGMSPNAVKKGVRTPVMIYWNGLGYAPYAPVAGNWSFTLTSVDTSYIRLGLYQNGDAVSGNGVLTYNGFNTPVTASGTVLGDRLALFVTPANTQNLYRLSLTIYAWHHERGLRLHGSGNNPAGCRLWQPVIITAPSVPAPVAPTYQTTQAVQTNQTQPVASA